MFKNLLFQTHWLIGISAGLVLAVVGATGALLSFEGDIQDWLNRDVRTVQASTAAPLRPAALLARAKEQLPDRRITAIALSASPEASARLTLAAAKSAAEGAQAPGRGAPAETRYVDPYSGALLAGDGTRGQAFFRNLRSLHRWLVAGTVGNREIGKQIVGASTLLCVVLVATGLYLRWPRRWRAWRSWLALDWRLKGRSFLWHLHAVVGTWVLAIFLVMSLTGLYWSYDWYRNGLYALAGVQPPPQRGNTPLAQARERAASAAPDDATVDLDAVWTAFLTTVGSDAYATATLNLPAQAGQPVEIRYLARDAAHERAGSTLSIDTATAQVLRHERYQDKRAGERFMSSIFPLHSGSFFGTAGVLAFFLASLAMPVFTVTGWMLYLDRRRKKRAANASRAQAQGACAAADAAKGDWLVVHASQAGFAREIAWQTAGALRAGGAVAEVVPASHAAARLHGASAALFVASTFGEGEPPDEARGLRRWLRTGSLPLKDLRYGVLALGDRRYDTYCGFGRDLDASLAAQGAQRLFATLEVDDGDTTALAQWRERVRTLAPNGNAGAWAEPSFEEWTLSARTCLNPGSVGGPTFHLELTPPSSTGWDAGDIAIVEIPAAHDAANGATREYSIASIPADGRVHLVVRQVRRDDGRLGLGSGWLTDTAPLGGPVRIRIRANPTFRAPDDARPLLLVGNGTGIAGLRSLLKARVAAGQRRNWLVFGERQAAHDAYYRDELETLEAQGFLERIDRVFSRDGATRSYVQHRLLAQADRVRAWIDDGAVVAVCGSAEGMAPAVEAAFGGILGTAGLNALVEQGRYRRDVY